MTELGRYTDALSMCLSRVMATSANGDTIDPSLAFQLMRQCALDTHGAGKKIIFVGNGGSAAIASHMATDYSKNGGVRAVCLNDSAMLTCLGNDFGYEHVFSKQIEFYARPDDFVITMDDSGRSVNIINAVKAARASECIVATLSGFAPTNPLRAMGAMNFYLPSDRYGYVEIGHLTILHAVLDSICGLQP